MSKSGIISFACGEESDAKTSLARGLALALAGRGNKVCLIDYALNNTGSKFPSGIKPPRACKNLVFYDLPLSYPADVICLGLDFISLNGSEIDHLLGRDSYDFVLVNNLPGFGKKNLSFCLAAEKLILIMNPSMSSLIKTYSLLKKLKQQGYYQIPAVLLDQIPDNMEAAKFIRRFSDKCEKNLGLTLSYLGSIPDEPPFPGESATYNQGRELSHPDSTAFQDFILNLSLKLRPVAEKSGSFEFWETSLASLIKHNINEIYGQKPNQKADSGHASEACDHDFLFGCEQPFQEEISKSFFDFDNKKEHGDESAGSGDKHLNKSLSGRFRIGIICSDESLRALLEDMFREKGLDFQNMLNGHHLNPDILICSMDKPDKRHLDTLKMHDKTPCIWLSQYKKHIPSWAAGLHLVQTLEKPFSLNSVYMAVEKAALKNKTSTDLKTAPPV